MNSRFSTRVAAFCGLLFGLAGQTDGHPLPDVLVRSFFNADGTAIVRVEIDPRSFTDDPLNEPYTQNWELGEMAEAERAELVALAKEYVEKAVEIRFLPEGEIEPDFQWRFTGHDDAPLEDIDDPVMLTGEWHTVVPDGLEGYQVHAREYRELSVYFLNHVRDRAIERYQVMFPGETSYVLDLKEFVAGLPERRVAFADPPRKKTALIVGLSIVIVLIPILMLAMILLKRRIES